MKRVYWCILIAVVWTDRAVSEQNVECFTSADCSGGHSSFTNDAGECCLESDESMSYITSDGSCMSCIVHGFSQWRYNIDEGESVLVKFQENIKGVSSYSELGLPLLGKITAMDERYFQLFEGQTDAGGRVRFIITTENDNITQDDEKWVMLSFEAYNYRFMEELETYGEFIRDSARINIADDDIDPCSVGFTTGWYDIIEGAGSVNVCVHLTCPPNKTNNVVVEVSTQSWDRETNGNHPTIGCEYITKDYDDYEEQIRGCNKLLSSPLREGDTVCYDQIIYDDHRVEETEYMNIRLYIKESEQATVTDTMYADISIEDDDFVVVGLEETSYITREDENFVEICAVIHEPNISCPCLHPFYLTVWTESNTAVWRDDFELKDRVIKFDSCETRKCVQVEIVNDDIVEDTETFNIVLDQSHFGLSFDVILEQDSTSILIENDDLAVVGFESATYDVEETGRDAIACVVVNYPNISCPVSTQFNIVIIIIEESATFSEDFHSDIIIPLEFDACQKRMCVEVAHIHGDEQIEEAESFVLVLVSESPDLVRLEHRVSEVIIHESGSENVFVQLTFDDYYVTEGDEGSVVILCAEVIPQHGCPVTFNFEVYMRVGEGAFLLLFDECQREICADIPIVDDLIVEEKQMLPVTLTRTEGLDQRIVVSNATGRLHIYDDYRDVSFIGLEANAYTASEDDGVVQVCVQVFYPTVETPIGFPFSLTIETFDEDTEGGLDYEPVSNTLLFNPGDTTKCQNISLIADQIREDTEIFIINISRHSDLEYRVMILEDEAAVFITDSDHE